MLGNQPSEQTLGLLIKLHEKRCVESFPLSRVANYAEGRDIKVEPARIKGTPLFMENGTISLTAKNRDFTLSAESFCHAVRVLMHGYSFVSMEDEPGNEWVSYEAAMSHVATVENISRANSKIFHRMQSQIMEADAAVRTEWAKLSQNRTELHLTNIIGIVAHRHAIWPLASEFTKASVKEKGRWNNQEWYPRSFDQPRSFEQHGKGRKGAKCLLGTTHMQHPQCRINVSHK